MGTGCVLSVALSVEESITTSLGVFSPFLPFSSRVLVFDSVEQLSTLSLLVSYSSSVLAVGYCTERREGYGVVILCVLIGCKSFFLLVAFALPYCCFGASVSFFLRVGWRVVVWVLLLCK